MQEQPNHGEQLARAGIEAGLKKLVALVGGGVVLVVILIVVLLADLAVFLGGGPPGPPPKDMPPTGGPLGRPLEWLAALPPSGLPNAVVLSVMAHESGGQVWATNYNCQQHKTAPEECSQYYHPGMFGIGTTLHTLSEDAGLMQINSGGWPKTPRWDALHMSDDPFDPVKNIPAGVHELAEGLAMYHYLPQALEAYNSGRSTGDQLYVADTMLWLSRYEAGPTLAAWTTADWKTDHWQARNSETFWIVASAAGPYGPKFSIPCKPSPPKCTSSTTAPTGTGPLPQGSTGTTTCKPQAPQMLKGRELVLPTSVVIRGPNGTVAMSLDPKNAPVFPGASAWAAEVRGPGVYTVTATWPAQAAMDRKTGKTAHVTPKAIAVVVVAKRGK